MRRDVLHGQTHRGKSGVIHFDRDFLVRFAEQFDVLRAANGAADVITEPATRKESVLESSLIPLFLVGVALWCYQSGKRKGSRQGFHAGRRSTWRHLRRQR